MKKLIGRNPVEIVNGHGNEIERSYFPDDNGGPI